MKRKISLIFLVISILWIKPTLATGEEPLSLSLEECVLKALQNNLQVAVEIYNPEIADATLTRAKEIFMPRFDLSYGNRQTEEPSYWWIQGAATVTGKYRDYSVSIVQQIPTGGNFSVSLAGDKSDTNQAFQLLNPRYGSTLRFEFSQPLLKDFGFKVSRKEILIAQNNLEISQHQLKTVLLDTIYQVQEAYWNLVYTIENHKVKQQSLELAKDLLAKNKKEVEVGKLAPIEILNAEAVVATREAEILQAEALIRTNEDLLKNIINMAEEQQISSQRIIPLDKPGFIKEKVSLDEAMKRAYMLRPDLEMKRTEIETNELNLSIAKNQMLPGLNFNLSYWSPGISGNRVLYLDDNPLTGIIVGTEQGSSTESLTDALKLTYNNWQASVTLSIPLSNFLTRAEMAKAKLELEKSQLEMENIQKQILLEVKNAVRDIETSVKRVEAFGVARELAERRLDAEVKKLDVGLTTNYFVLQFQDELAAAQSEELKAIVDNNLAWAKLEKALGISLDKRNIKMPQLTK